jgi:hypothetical protein
MIVTDEDSSPDRPLDRGTDDPPHAHRNDDRRWTSVLAHRWPTDLGVAVLTAFGLEADAEFVSSHSALGEVMALVYVGAAPRLLGRAPRRAAGGVLRSPDLVGEPFCGASRRRGATSAKKVGTATTSTVIR